MPCLVIYMRYSLIYSWFPSVISFSIVCNKHLPVSSWMKLTYSSILTLYAQQCYNQARRLRLWHQKQTQYLGGRGVDPQQAKVLWVFIHEKTTVFISNHLLNCKSIKKPLIGQPPNMKYKLQSHSASPAFTCGCFALQNNCLFILTTL